MLYNEVTSHANQVDNVMIYITVISVIFLLGITFTMLYFVFKYNRKKHKQASDIHGNALLEITWIVIPTILVLTMFYFGFMGYKGIKKIPDNAFKITGIAKMWQWNFEYPNGKKSDTLYVPSGKPVEIQLKSLDVNHSLYIPAYRVKQDVVMGKTNYIVINPEKTGSYDIACAEYCGLNHSMMYTKLVVMDSTDFNEWYASLDTQKETDTGEK